MASWIDCSLRAVLVLLHAIVASLVSAYDRERFASVPVYAEFLMVFFGFMELKAKSRDTGGQEVIIV
jgi:hypothetical protein